MSDMCIMCVGHAFTWSTLNVTVEVCPIHVLGVLRTETDAT